MARNAKDYAVSYFHFGRMNRGQPQPGDCNTFLNSFVEGKVVFGSWYDHVNGWWEKKQTYSNLHYMFYKDMIEMEQPTSRNPLRQILFNFHGVYMTKYCTDNWEKVQSFKARPDDILISTYPKAGTTWVSYILDLLYFGQACAERQTSIPIYERVPFLEFCLPPMPTGTDLADMLTTSPRLIKTHLPVQFIPKCFWEQNCRMVYVARNAKDNAVSFFHFDHMTLIQPEPGDWSSYLQRFMEGKTVFGSWYDHVSGWWEKKQTYSNIHYMFYEDLVEDCGREVDQLCSFLGLSSSPEGKERVLTDAKFENMKQNKMTNYSTFDVMDHKVYPFMRKGKVGDWKNHFTVAQNEMFDEDYKQKMKNPALSFRTEL